ncbi:uncharacterized protein B0T23DRAFT_427096 [Neurospora hispaniola]|uniref:Conidiation-specific protein 8 n=1 Tax=Neurospora hispaniola TaxID=588809 RepID=A0AAJ0IE28_9PEZI|nr:hypothetical protein B0T23DRAFT_427096 [Neurospora hispaniola]
MDDTGSNPPIAGPFQPAHPPTLDNPVTEAPAPHTSPVAGKTGPDAAAQGMSGGGARGSISSESSKLIDESTKLFPNVAGAASEAFRSERSASTSSTTSVTGSDRPMGSASTVTEVPYGRRPSHGHGGHHGLFEGLIDQKRRNDPASVARRQSLSEQRPVPQGFIAKMWDNWVRGAPPDI